jgi:hypothetical protein
MRRPIIRSCVAAIAVASLSLVPGAAAQNLEKGKGQRLFATSVTLVRTANPAGADTWTGTVSSPKRGCLGGRRIFLDQGWPVGQIGLNHMAGTYSAANGTFSFTFEPLTGGYAYSANARYRRISPKGKRPVDVCDGGVSFAVLGP